MSNIVYINVEIQVANQEEKTDGLKQLKMPQKLPQTSEHLTEGHATLRPCHHRNPSYVTVLNTDSLDLTTGFKIGDPCL